MEISLFEIAAQIINFFVLLLILNYLFYGPVVKAMEDRKVRILKAEDEAKEKTTQAEKLIHDYQEKIQGVEDDKKRMINSYRKEALMEKESLLHKYQKEADNKRTIYMDSVEEEKENFIRRLKKELGKSGIEIASKILETISSKDLEEEVFEAFIRDLENLKETLAENVDLSKEEYLILTSSKALSEQEKNRVQDVLEKSISDKIHIKYESDPNLIIGHELNLETYTIHNSIKTYLNEIEDRILKLLDNQEF